MVLTTTPFSPLHGLRIRCFPDVFALFLLHRAYPLHQDVVIYGKGFGAGVAFLSESGQTVARVEHFDMHFKSITGTHALRFTMAD